MMAVVVPWLFLAVSVWGGLFTLNALRPVQSILGFFPAWLTTELALHHIAWQALATVGFVYFGALQHMAGMIGMALTLLSWVGLAWLLINAHLDGKVVHDALERVLGPAFREEVAHAHALHLRTGIDWRRVLWPFWMSHSGVECLRNIPYDVEGIVGTNSTSIAARSWNLARRCFFKSTAAPG
jgi:hypothetical protein